jgi:uncharacterized protein with von Willebrand factor type A (vWA) domain
MPKVQIDRKPEIQKQLNSKEKKVIISSRVSEEYTPQEYTAMYYQKVNELNNMKSTLQEGKNQLRQYEDIEETPEIKELKEKLVKAEKLKTRDNLREQIKKLELNVARMEKEVEQLTPVSKKLNE